MKYIFCFLAIISFSLGTQAQRISRVTMNNTSITESITVSLDDAIVNISLTGTIINYGIDYASERVTNYTRLEKYNGRIDMFTTYEDKAFQGKVKYLGKTPITYYASYDLPELQGKVKTIGSLSFTYYMNYDDEALKGKIKSIGSNAISFYSSFENDALKGKLKGIGNTQLTYYSNFDDVAFRGKVKSIGQVSFTYYPSYDKQFQGAMKTGNRTQNVNGINFLVN